MQASHRDLCPGDPGDLGSFSLPESPIFPSESCLYNFRKPGDAGVGDTGVGGSGPLTPLLRPTRN